ncbi:hypothetical protein D3C84_764910 [compost metagenome]
MSAPDVADPEFPQINPDGIPVVGVIRYVHQPQREVFLQLTSDAVCHLDKLKTNYVCLDVLEHDLASHMLSAPMRVSCKLVTVFEWPIYLMTYRRKHPILAVNSTPPVTDFGR